ncbi:MFS general substrate transporter [Metarhizium brunneum]
MSYHVVWSLPRSPTQKSPTASSLLGANLSYTLNAMETPTPLVIFSLCFIGFTASLDGSIIAIALPHRAKDLELGDKYIPVANCVLFAQTVVQPGISQLCDISGRRWSTILSVVMFALGSSIAGGANNATTMIAGRTV